MRTVQKLPIHPCPTCTAPSLRTSPTSAALVTTGEPILTYHSHPKSVVHTAAHFGYCALCGSGRVLDATYPSLWCCTEYFRCPEIFLCSARSSFPFSPSNPWQPLIFLLSPLLPFPECYTVGIIQCESNISDYPWTF